VSLKTVDVSTTPRLSTPAIRSNLDERGLILPPIPEIPVSTPPRF
jgi:hypothetical protein